MVTALDPPTVPLDRAEVERLLEASGALRRGHFRLSSGLHSPAYVQCALLLEDPRRVTRLARALARRLASLRPDSVLAPAMGGLVIGYGVAEALGVPFRFTERVSAGTGEEKEEASGKAPMALRRGFALREGERVVVIEDVVTTGGSAREAVAVAEEHGARVVAVGSVIDRSGGRGNPFDPTPWFALAPLDFDTWQADECPLCAEGGTPEKPGSRPG